MLKRAVLTVLAKKIAGRLLASIRRQRLAIVMMHRFADGESQRFGHRAAELASVLTELRSAGVRFASLEELLIQAERTTCVAPTQPMVAFTVDDGYADFRDIGLPIFLQFGCPVTCFVVPDVVDAKRWFWWDQIDWLSRNGGATSVEISIPGFSGPICLSTTDQLVNALKSLSTDQRERVLVDTINTWGGEFPVTPPKEYGVLSWDDMRAIESQSVQFGAHTLTHPILSRCDNRRAEHEILESVARVRNELLYPSPVFCFPNGMEGDFGKREQVVLQSIPEVKGALSAIPRALSVGSIGLGSDLRWQIPRFAFDSRAGAMTRNIFL
jgi:peptidoglycan/xylan/chitin deacetylase (PgdA/CDA1 family)